MAKEIVRKAYRYRHAIVLEDLKRLRELANEKTITIRWKLSLFAYRKLQHSIVTKAVEHNVPVIFVNPKGTSSVCPRCGTKLTYIYRLGVCEKCRFIADRDVIGAVNIWLRALHAYAGELGSLLSASPMNDEARGRGGIRDEGMKHVIKTIQK
jgi:putative transposase